MYGVVMFDLGTGLDPVSVPVSLPSCIGLGKIRQLGQLTRIIRHVQTWTLSFWYNIT